jgi:energy-converting hydrogenase Eha subunit B
MFDNLVRSYVGIGLVVFGLRAVLYELGMAPWAVILGLAVALMVIYGVNHSREAVNRIRSRIGIYPAGRRAT